MTLIELSWDVYEMKLNTLHKMFIVLISITLFLPINIDAKANNSTYSIFQVLEKQDNKVEDLTKCEGILGNIDDEDSVAWLLQKLLNYVKILGPSIAVVLGSIDFLKAIITSDDESMKKTQATFKNRMIAAVLLFFIPFMVSFLLELTGIVVSDASCGLS